MFRPVMAIIGFLRR